LHASLLTPDAAFLTRAVPIAAVLVNSVPGFVVNTATLFEAAVYFIQSAAAPNPYHSQSVIAVAVPQVAPSNAAAKVPPPPGILPLHA